MRVFLDTNVILDFFDSRRGHYLPTAILFDLAFKGKLELVVCSQSFITAFYILGKSYEKGELYQHMRSLFKLCNVSAVDAKAIEQALNIEGRDFEDTVQYISSASMNADVIITRDRKGFNGFDIRHITVEEFLNEFLP